ncbi:hypothetical protein Glove_86g122 [Diversispora epigaea]|uniref:Uncharacterized protein n=1 Tax=Diversispora epigaea TaxID=1348612 RepID=A0A397J6T4_9GLOM|nr:hypothetical protein Glove_86g122 [Diversispora epigaea]
MTDVWPLCSRKKLYFLRLKRYALKLQSTTGFDMENKILSNYKRCHADSEWLISGGVLTARQRERLPTPVYLIASRNEEGEIWHDHACRQFPHLISIRNIFIFGENSEHATKISEKFIGTVEDKRKLIVKEKDSLIDKNTELLAKEAGLMARIVELEQSAKETADNAKLRNAELNSRIVELAQSAKENAEFRTRVTKLEQKQSQNDKEKSNLIPKLDEILN